MKNLYLIIMVIVTLVVGLALVGPAASLIRGAQTDLNCSTSHDAYTKLPCVLTSMTLWYFCLAMLMFIGIIYFRNKQSAGPEDYGAYGPSSGPYAYQ